MKNQIAAVVTILAITFIIEPVFDGLLPHVGRWLPLRHRRPLRAAWRRRTPMYLLSWWLAAIVLIAWGLVPILIGYFATFKKTSPERRTRLPSGCHDPNGPTSVAVDRTGDVQARGAADD